MGECQHLHCMGIEKGQYSSTSDLQTCLCICGNYQCVPVHGLPLIRIPVLQSPSVKVVRGYALLIFSILLKTLVEVFHHYWCM